MKKVRKLVALLTLTATVLSVFSIEGCNSSSNSKKVSVDIFQYKVEAKEALEDAAKEYEKENPNVEINVETVGGGSDYNAALKTKFSSGEEPVIYNIGGTQDANDWKDKLEDLSAESWVQKAYDGTLDAVTLNGKVYGMPLAQEGYGLVYNKELLSKAGIDAEKIATFDELQKAFETLDSKKAELGIDSVFVLPGNEKWVQGLHLTNVAFSNEFKSSKEAYESKSIEFKYADQLKKLVDLELKYAYKPDGKDSSVNGVDYSTQVEKQFALGKAAIIQQGNWIYGTLKGIDEKIADNVGILPMPLEGVSEGKIPVGVPYYWAVNSTKTDEEKEAAKDFLNWLYTSDEGKKRIINDFNFIPAIKGYDSDELQPKDPLSKSVIKYCNEGKTMPWVFMGYPTGWGENNIGADMQKYFSGDYTWEQFVKTQKETWSNARNQ
ncbi:ABC transporter substrate-binding protein [Clostridium sp. HCP1S3_B4]|uniref:ABC transporter substrate-binding protein n=1 Tax=unclassified Clostridium TaxID=2614128 RepID=UPI002A7AC6BF|nr:extracellular solute-binding protein [Clostridium sp.]